MIGYYKNNMAVGITSTNHKAKLLNFAPNPAVYFQQVAWNKSLSIKRLYHADNIDVLNFLLQDESVFEKVKLIYIDPPYNTGGAFETRDFRLAYDDNLSMNDYLEFMEQRLRLLHKLLSNDGSMYVHLDSNMVFHIKVMMDRIFGPQNFKGMITRKKCKSKNYTKKTYGNISDYILYYTKTDAPIWNRPYEQWNDEKITKEYPCIEEQTGRRYKKVPIHAPGVRNGATGGVWRNLMPPQGKHWQFTPDKLDEMDANGEIYWSSNGNPRRKVYLDNSQGIPVQDIWLEYPDVNNQNTRLTGYPTEKNLDMLKRIIEASSQKGDLVLDCFAGSGTTLIAAEELERQWIGIDIGKEAISTIIKRFKNGTQPIGDYVEKKIISPKTLDLFSEDFSSQQTIDESTEITYDLFIEK